MDKPKSKPKSHSYFFIFIIVIVVLFVVVLGGVFSSTIAKTKVSNGTYPEIGNLKVLNSIMSDIGNYALPPPNFPMAITGTINNFDCGDSDLFNFSGSEGNKTSAGYYASYGLQIESIKNGFNFTIDQIDPTSTESNALQLVSGNFTASFNAEISVKATVSAKGEVYIPESKTCSKACGPCCSNPLESCFYKWNCNCINTCVPWPSTYTPDLLIPIKVPATLTISGATISGNIGYSASNDSSLTPIGSILKKKKVSGYDGKKFYLFNILLSNMNLSYPSSGSTASLDGNSAIVDDQTVKSFINSLISTLQGSANSYFNATTFDVQK